MSGPLRAALVSLVSLMALTWGGPLPALAADAPVPGVAASEAPAVAPAPAAMLSFRITPALLKAALAHDVALGHAMADFVRQGIALSSAQAGRQGRLVFVPRSAEALTAFIDDPSTPFPDAPASAPPAGEAAYHLEAPAQGPGRLLVGVGAALPRDGQAATAPKRWFELTVAVDAGALTALAWRPLPLR